MGAYDCDCINNLEYDRRERKAQLSKEGTTKGTTSDLISRMETVEHLRRVLDATVPITDYDEGYVDGVEFGISTVSTMPTIQPQSTNLIDRQDAIDALDCINGVEEVLRSLPSVQPEPAIPLSWIENEIKWLKSLDNTFSEITALQISVMVKKWRDEQNEQH
jgi:hypothetical protein